MAGMARLVLWAIALFLALSSSALGIEDCRWVTGTTFAVCIPERAVFSTRDDSDLDFVVHSLSGAGLPEITIYEGNHPEALPRPEGAHVGRARIGSVRAKKHSYESGGGRKWSFCGSASPGKVGPSMCKCLWLPELSMRPVLLRGL